MRFDFAIALDFLSPLALIAILSWSYGLIRLRLAGDRMAPVVLGLAFGLVALLQMHAPLSPIPGVIVDLRAVPVALAGAYLGWRGLVACLAVALAARWQIGGIGLLPDLVGIVHAAAAGHLWDRSTRRNLPRGLGHIMALALIVSLGALSGMFLPQPLAAWVLTSAAPMLIFLTLVALPALAAILERERHAQAMESRSRAECAARARAELLSEGAFIDRVVDLRAAAGQGPLTGPPVVAVLIVDLNHRYWPAGRRDATVIGHVRGGLRDRLAGLIRHGDLVGRSQAGCVLVALDAGDAMRVDTLTAAIHRIVADLAITLPDGDSARVGVAVRLVPLGDAMSAPELAARLGGRTIPGDRVAGLGCIACVARSYTSPNRQSGARLHDDLSRL